MPLWGSKDNSANSDIAAVIQVRRGVTSANQTSLYENITPGTFVTNEAIGQFGVSTDEVRAGNDAGRPVPAHAGWVLRHEGTGLKAGRVWYETLVAMGSMSGDGSDDTYFPDFSLKVSVSPTTSTSATPGNVAFTSTVTTMPAGATIAYQWQRYNGSSWVSVANTAGRYFNVTSPVFTANNVTANGNVFRVMVTTTGANAGYSSSATISYVV